MFDFIAEISVDNSKSILDKEFFNSVDVYKKLSYINNSIELDNSKFVYLNKHEKSKSVFEDTDFVVLIHGYCFTRLKSEDLPEKKRLFADDIVNLFKKYDSEFYKHIKGSYSIVIFEKSNNKVNVFTDEFNLRKIYYSTNQGKLVISSSLSAFSAY